MKTRDLTAAAFVLAAAFGTSFAACSAQSSGSPPRTDTSGGSTGSGGTGSGTAGTFGTGTAGTFGTGTAGTFGTGTAGTLGTGTAGTFGTGTAGTFGTGAGGTGTGAGGTGSGTAGTGGAAAMSCGTLTRNPADMNCCIAAGTAADLPIDNLEDGDNVIMPNGNRQGYWYFYNDKVNNPASMTTQVPSMKPFPPMAGGTTGSALFSAATSGSLGIATAGTAAAPGQPTYAGIGFDFNNHFMKSCAYGGSAYKGISFWAKGTSPFRAVVKIPATTPASDTTAAGTCTGTCNDHYGKIFAPLADWKQFFIVFGDATFTQAGWGTAATFDASNLLGVQFQVDGDTTATAATPYSFAIDDVAFTP